MTHWNRCTTSIAPCPDRGRQAPFVMTVPRTLWDKLRRSIDGEVRADNAALALYAADASVYRQVPLGVVIPRHEGLPAHLSLASNVEDPSLC